MNTTDLNGPINGVKLSDRVKDYTGWDFRIWPKKICGRFAGTKRSGRINEVKVTRGSTVCLEKKIKTELICLR